MEYLDKTGLKTFLAQLKGIFGLKTTVDIARSALDTYILNVDYTELEFNTDYIVGDASSELGYFVLGESILG